MNTKAEKIAELRERIASLREINPHSPESVNDFRADLADDYQRELDRLLSK